MINTEDRPTTEILMDAISSVEGADKVVILLERDDSITVKTNCSYKDLKWLLDQASHVAMCELYGITSGE